jgi:hypothetical protein
VNIIQLAPHDFADPGGIMNRLAGFLNKIKIFLQAKQS